ncbi:cytochrome c peroxidase [Aureisphaera galaxeae]|uniref:cytochrome-c peroxidase n=1 Tax=Aureisphaera galaxeae TaxID=1538023 RepID=UPI0023504CFA|nr:cytochrome c peroxidase [Aureisphaera galaxeae]MDC8002849.1 cytochrome c peroxidase [Aureisphaera galaxeae]
MKTDTFFFLGSMFLAALLILASKPKRSTSAYIDKAIGTINEKFHEDLSSCYDATVQFHEAAISFQRGDVSEPELEREYSQLRETFKKIEFFVEYLDKEAFDKTLNGAPLPKLEKKVADLRVLQPRGMQVIDEFMASGFSTSDREDLVAQAYKLENDVKKIEQFLGVRRVTDRQFFEASRQALIRLATLGITGFDTPGTQHGISDATVVLQIQQEYMQLYKSELRTINSLQLLKEYTLISNQGIAQTQEGNFENFDRLSFIKNVVTPLYKGIKDIHLALDYETIEEVSRYPLAVNYDADHLFEKDFLNKFYYVSIANDTSFNKIASLGKLLFYDPVLSRNNTISCSSCHAPEKAFTDGLTTSKSNTGSPLKRNSMTLNYSVYASAYFHDLRTKRLEDQFEHVVLNKDEFDSSYPEIVEKLNTSPTYSKKFVEAFPAYDKPIKPNNIDYALAAYVMQFTTFDSPVDAYFQGTDASLSEEVKNGFNLFTGKANCATCHFLPTFSGLVPPLYKETEAEVLGVPENNYEPWILDDDIGRLGNGVTQEVATFYNNAFKTPTVRNIEKTGPYMHNGVYNTLEEVMEFYNLGGGAGLGFGMDHQTLAPDPLNLTDTEIEEIIAFMNSLNDKKEFMPPTDLPRDFPEKKLNERELIK